LTSGPDGPGRRPAREHEPPLEGDRSDSPERPPPADRGALRRSATVIAAGVLATGLGWPGLLGRLPFGLLLKNQMGASPEQVAGFWAIATVAWYLKPLVALACESYPLFGTRRRGYLMTGAGLAGAAWLGFAVVPRTFGPFLALMTLLNLGLVVVSSAIGGLIVEAGQRHGATGRLSALRSSLEGVMALITGPVGGALAAAAFVYTSVTGAAMVLAVVPTVWWLVREPVVEASPRSSRSSPLGVARRQIATLVRSRSAWAASALLFLVFLSPGLQTPLLYYQQDVLRLGPRMMGVLQMIGGAGAMAGAASYAWVCRRVPLRWSLVVGLILGALSALLYLGYRSLGAALIIDGLSGFLGALATLPLYDLAARATPRGTESLAYALLMSVRTVALVAISDPVGSWLYGRIHLRLAQLAWVNALSTLAVLLLIPWLPRALLASRERDAKAARV
jgi:BT1 family